jgi:hypothetical protein
MQLVKYQILHDRQVVHCGRMPIFAQHTYTSSQQGARRNICQTSTAHLNLTSIDAQGSRENFNQFRLAIA